MNKTIILLAFIGFSVAGFSQSTVSNNSEHKDAAQQKVNVTNKAGLKAVKLGEKIQVTEEGVVRFSEQYTPKYPASMVEPEKKTVKNIHQIKIN
ncbi:MAG: hypothetical protein P8Q14_03965 [Vicingaceae bacterium]|nr:hypothetical protein [Vicingaceae bacterium]